MAVFNFLRRSLVPLLAAYMLLLPRLSESCMSCFHPENIAQNHNNRYHHGRAINVAASRGIHPFDAGSGSNSIAAATTAARQLLGICQKRCLNLQKSICTIPNYKRSLRLSASAALVTGGMIVIARYHAPSAMKHKLHRGLWRNELADSQDDEAIADSDKQAGDKDEEEPVASSAMIATIGIYKNFISPLLPPACRFVPTCSQYGVQAIKEYGPNKGVVLTAWRLMRCSPFGGKGYDPPKWPPVSYTYSSY